MENKAHDFEGSQVSEPSVVPALALPQPPLLPAPAPEVDALAGSDCTEIVPSVRQLAPSDAESADPDFPLLPDHLRQIPFRLELRVPLSRFTLRDLQQLEPGALLATEHLSVRDLVLTAAGERLLLVELEAMEQQLAARVKRLAWRHKWRRKA